MSEKKKERLFVIMEVEKHSPKRMTSSYYTPVGSLDERMYLQPSRIIREGRLRYGKPYDDMTFVPPFGWEDGVFNIHQDRLILDPEPEAEKRAACSSFESMAPISGFCKRCGFVESLHEEKDEWEEWADDAPPCIDDRTKNWLKRMPKREE